MAKPTKRERKFQASGGVKRRMEKGGLGGKKFRKRRKPSTTPTPTDDNNRNSQRTPKAKDLLSDDNIGNLDIDSFFEQLVEDGDATTRTTEPQEPPISDDEDDGSDDAMEEKDEKENAVDQPESSSESSDLEERKEEEEFVRTVVTKKKNSRGEEPVESEEDSDDDDIEAAEERMKKEMDKMKEADPEFHDFLQENEEELLEFGNDEDGEEDLDAREDDGKEQTASAKIHLTPKLLAALKENVFKAHGIKALRKLVGAYKAACHLSDASSDELKGSGSQFIIDSSKIFDDLMVLCLNRVHEEFEYHLLNPKQGSEEKREEEDDDIDDEEEGGKEARITAEDVDEKESAQNRPIPPKRLEKAEKWTQLQPIMQSFFKSTLHVMTEAKEPKLLVFILKALSTCNKYLTPFPKLADTMLKTLTSLWSAPLDSSEEYQVVRLNAFFRIRQMALTQPFPFIESILKKTYLAYAKRAKFGTGSSVSTVLPTLTFMGNCLCEIYSLDHHSSYQHAFVYIRQLALLLRSAMHKKTPEAVQQVYCWQYVHCLKLWVAVLSDSTMEQDSLLRSLIYPLTEVIMGTIRFIPSPTKHLPFRLHCVRFLQQLAASSETFIPTSGILLECLDWKEWYMQPKKTKKASSPPQMEYIIKLLPKEDALRTHDQLEASIHAWFVLLNRDIELYRFSPGFPEYASRITQRLRQFNKQATRQARWRAQAKASLETCEKYTDFCVTERGKLSVAPKDVPRLECLRPASIKTMNERHNESIVREQKILDAKLAVSGPIKKNKKEEDDEEDEDDDSVKDKNEKADGNSKKKTKKNKQKQKRKPRGAINEKALEQEDAVREGVDWSDDED